MSSLRTLKPKTFSENLVSSSLRLHTWLRHHGRPRQCWTDDIKERTGIATAKCVKMAQDRH